MSSASLLDTASQAGANGNLRVVQNAQKAARTEFTSTASKSSPNESLASPCLTAEDMDAAAAIISKWEGYAPTALHDLDEVAARVGVRRVLYKDESSRFGLRSFKALGGAYAVAGVAAAHGPNVLPSLTVTSVTDGTRHLRGRDRQRETERDRERQLARVNILYSPCLECVCVCVYI